MAGVSTHDVAVIGAGVVGACAAHALARGGARVIVLEAGRAGHGTSGTTFAWVNSARKEPEVYHRLNAAGMAAHQTLAAELGGEIGYHGGGSLEWAEDAHEQKELEARVARLAARGYAAEWISRAQALVLEPGLAIPAGVERVVFYAADGWVDVPRLIQRLLEAARVCGAEIREATPAGLRARGDHLTVTAGAAEIAARSMVACVGPGTASFLSPLGVTLPVGRVPGLLAVTSAPAAPLARVVHAPGVHLRPHPGGGLLLGAPDVDRLVDETTSPADLARHARPLLERAARVFPAARDVRLVEARAGVRPMPGDGQTIAGRIPGFASAWVLATHSGVTLGPLLGHALAAEILGTAPAVDLSPFRPERFHAA